MSTQETHTHKPSPDSGRSGGPATLEADGLGSYPTPPGRRHGRRWVAGVLAVAVLGGAGWWAGGHPGLDRGSKAAAPAAPLSTATVQRQDLSGQTKVSGTLGYAGSATVQSPLQGRITWLPTAGQVVGRGISFGTRRSLTPPRLAPTPPPCWPTPATPRWLH